MATQTDAVAAAALVAEPGAGAAQGPPATDHPLSAASVLASFPGTPSMFEPGAGSQMPDLGGAPWPEPLVDSRLLRRAKKDKRERNKNGRMTVSKK